MPTLKCEQIEATSATQIRVKLDKSVIDMYQQDIEDGADFPAIVVFNEGKGSKRYILADGFHRLLAHVNAGRDKIDCEVRKGGMHEALLHALGANRDHGLRRSNADKRHAVEMALKDPEISQLTRQEIADICGVTKRTVQKLANNSWKDDEGGVNGSPPEKPRKANGDDVRPSKPEPNQADIELEELREGLATFKRFPYDGTEAGKLALEDDDLDGLRYVSEWCAQAVLAAGGGA